MLCAVFDTYSDVHSVAVFSGTFSECIGFSLKYASCFSYLTIREIA